MLNSIDLVICAIVPSWVQIVFMLVFRRFEIYSCRYFGSEIFSCGYFVGIKFLIVGILWVQNLFSWVFRGSKIFLVGFLVSEISSREYFVGP